MGWEQVTAFDEAKAENDHLNTDFVTCLNVQFVIVHDILLMSILMSMVSFLISIILTMMANQILSVSCHNQT